MQNSINLLLRWLNKFQMQARVLFLDLILLHLTLKLLKYLIQNKYREILMLLIGKHKQQRELLFLVDKK